MTDKNYSIREARYQIDVFDKREEHPKVCFNYDPKRTIDHPFCGGCNGWDYACSECTE